MGEDVIRSEGAKTRRAGWYQTAATILGITAAFVTVLLGVINLTGSGYQLRERAERVEGSANMILSDHAAIVQIQAGMQQLQQTSVKTQEAVQLLAVYEPHGQVSRIRTYLSLKEAAEDVQRIVE